MEEAEAACHTTHKNAFDKDLYGCHPSSVNEHSLAVDELLLNEQGLQCFAFHCRAFFESATSLDKEKDKFEEKVALSTRVLKALDHLSCSINDASVEASNNNEHQFSDPKILREIRRCGLHDITVFVANPALLEPYITIRNQQRSLVHHEQMRKRLTLFYDLLYKTEKYPNKLTEKFLRNFVKKYYGHVGSHAFMAGLRTVLEKQIVTDGHPYKLFCLSWTFDVAAITESCHASRGDLFIKDVLTLLTGVFTRISEDGEVMISFLVSPSWSDEDLRRLVQCLPGLGRLNARPTGSTDVTNLARSLGMSLSREAKVDTLSTLHGATVKFFGCLKIGGIHKN